MQKERESQCTGLIHHICWHCKTVLLSMHITLDKAWSDTWRWIIVLAGRLT